MATSKTGTPEHLTAFLEEIKKQTDRGAGIVAAALVEDALRRAIESRLVALPNTRLEGLFGRYGPLATFSTKIELGMAIGLYDDNLRKVLNMIRGVRNEFAHEMQATGFDYPKIAESVLRVRTPSMPKEATVRETFTLCFVTAIMLLYAEAMFEDIRVKQVGETHPQIFVTLALAARTFQQQQASSSTESPAQPETASPGQKPPPGRR